MAQLGGVCFAIARLNIRQMMGPSRFATDSSKISSVQVIEIEALCAVIFHCEDHRSAE
jgi:hypothetical protein